MFNEIELKRLCGMTNVINAKTFFYLIYQIRGENIQKISNCKGKDFQFKVKKIAFNVFDNCRIIVGLQSWPLSLLGCQTMKKGCGKE